MVDVGDIAPEDPEFTNKEVQAATDAALIISPSLREMK